MIELVLWSVGSLIKRVQVTSNLEVVNSVFFLFYLFRFASERFCLDLLSRGGGGGDDSYSIYEKDPA